MTAPAIRVRGLGKDFGDRHAVIDVDVEVATGGVFGLLGPNGAGKTTMIRLLNGLITATTGSVELFGEAVTPRSADRLRARIGVQTDTELYAAMTVRENLATWGELFGMPSPRIVARIPEVLDVLGLADRADSPVGQLSKGMRQKAAIARALLHEPELLFLDEPTAGLDPEAAADLIGYLREVIRTGDTTIVLTTHQLHGLESLCDHLGILVAGRLVVAGEVDALLAERRPRTRVSLRLGGDLVAAREVLAPFGPVTLDDEGVGVLEVPRGTRVSDAVAALVHRGIAVETVAAQAPTIEELYFSVVSEGSLR
ncbi:MAG: ABC transporter ATP-binding protein [Protaetiibacter sp.]